MKNFTLSLVCLALVLFSCNKEQVPTLTTAEVTNIAGTSAVCGGTITSEGSGTVLTRGVCWSTGTSPTIADSKTVDGAGAGSFTSNVNGLNGATNYYIRAYATNEAGTGYGMAMSFKTMGQTPVLSVEAITNLGLTSATINVSINPNYLSTSVYVEYGISTSYGNTVTASNNPILGSSNVFLNINISSLIPGTTYHYRIKGVNSIGTTNTDDFTFTTGQKPSYLSMRALRITSSSAILTCMVNPNYLLTSIKFEYGLTSSYGKTIFPSPSDISGSTFQLTSATLDTISEATIYHYRLRAENILGVTFSDDQIFTTPPKVTDADGNKYKSVIVGTQIWMAENLKTTKFNDGTAIPLITDNSIWSLNNIIGYCWYDNDLTNILTYGGIYNWFTVNTGKLCPFGWHVPSDTDWLSLVDYLGGTTIAGGKLKETGTSHWLSPNYYASDESGFTALPGGRRELIGNFMYLHQVGYHWSSSELIGSGDAFMFDLANTLGEITRAYDNKRTGISVRCIKDQ